MQRHGSVLELRPEKAAEYRALHAAVWPGVLRMLRECHLRNYSIFERRIGDRIFLFSYFEYTGSDYAADLARIAADPETRRWWAICGPCQQPLSDRAAGEWWAGMDEVFHAE